MKSLLLIALAVVLCSCASHRYGNFTQGVPGKETYLAQDAVSQMARVYPPAQHTLCLSQKVTDGFGRALIQGLRQKGYGVIETSCSKQKANFFYVLDELQTPNLYRITLFVNQQILSRLYLRTPKHFGPASPWTHKE
ncbi:conjugal transfer protein TrbH [Legionella pneumophila serogroup 1]